MAKSQKQILKELLAELEPVLRNAFLAAIADVTDTAVLTVLIKQIEAQNYQAAFRALGMSDAALRPITAAIEQIFERGGVRYASTFPRIVRDNEAGAIAFRFDVRNVRAENWLREQSSRLVTRIQEDTRINIQTMLTENLASGNNPRTTALDIVGRVDMTTGRRVGGIIGLSQPQLIAVRNARLDLETLSPRYFTRLRRDKRFDGIVQKAIADGKPLDSTTIDKLIARYKDSLLKLRGDNIARTETIQSLNRAQYESYKQAIDGGAAKASAVTREWDSAGDARVRHSHAKMDGQQVGLDEAFTAPDGSKMMFPGDTSLGASASETINCRCVVKFKTDWLAALADDDDF